MSQTTGTAVVTRSSSPRLFSPHEDIRIITFSGVSGAGKNKAAAVLQHLCPHISMIRSVTTRELRPGKQDLEYDSVSLAEFENLRTNLLWETCPHGTYWYGTRRADIDEALNCSIPSVMHLAHETVPILQDYVQSQVGKPGVFSFLVACADQKTLRKRIQNRDQTIRDEEVERRVANCEQEQQTALESGLYHGIIWSHDSKRDPTLVRELIDHLRGPIPKPRTF